MEKPTIVINGKDCSNQVAVVSQGLPIFSAFPRHGVLRGGGCTLRRRECAPTPQPKSHTNWDAAYNEPSRELPGPSHLQRDDDHENLLVLIGEDVLNKSPACTNESNGDEQQGAF